MKHKEQARRELNEWVDAHAAPALNALVDAHGTMIIQIGDGLPVILYKEGGA